MKFHVSCRIFLGLFFLLQLSQAGEKNPEKLALFMQKNVENLIEKILSQVQEYYHEIKSSAKCIPESVPDNIMHTLKTSIDCVSENEKNYALGKIKGRAHMRNFLNCFAQAKKEVNKTMMSIDPEEDYCPENITEKTYQINVTTTFVKTFKISISNGLEVTHKEIDFSKDNCQDKNNENNENGNEDYIKTPDIYYNDNNDDNITISGIFNDKGHGIIDLRNEVDTDIITDTDNTEISFETSGTHNVNTETTTHTQSTQTTYGTSGIYTVTTQNTEITHGTSGIHEVSTDIINLRNELDTDSSTEIYNEYHSNNDADNGNNIGKLKDESDGDEDNNEGKSSPEEDSLDEYSFDYDGSEENQENSFNDYDDKSDNPHVNNLSNAADKTSFVREKSSKNYTGENAFRNNSEEEEEEEDEEEKAVLPNAGKRNLVSDVYTEFRKLQEDDDYYDMKNDEKIDLEKNYEESDGEQDNHKNEKRKRWNKSHPKTLKKYFNDGGYTKNS